jgi:hypothetical protein
MFPSPLFHVCIMISVGTVLACGVPIAISSHIISWRFLGFVKIGKALSTQYWRRSL